MAATYSIFSQTVDEPLHIASGFEWLTTRGYRLDIEHPPLARIAFALAPYLRGAEVNPDAERLHQGNEILYANGRYISNLAASRAGNLPFLAIAIIVVALWARRLFDTPTTILAAAFFSALPPVLGHAGVATTDLAGMTFTVAAAFALARCLDAPGPLNIALLGVSTGLGLLSKFSFPLFFGIAAVALVASRAAMRLEVKRIVLPALLSAAGAALIVWAGYKFDVGTLNEVRAATQVLRTPESEAARYARVPGYEWVRPDIMVRWWEYGEQLARERVYVDFVDWAKEIGYPSPLAGRHGDSMASAPPPPPLTTAQRILEPVRRALHWFALQPIPAPAFIAGIEFVRIHNRMGHPSFLLGEHNFRGSWLYFPVVFFFKTPIVFLGLSLAGLVTLARQAMAIRSAEMFAIALAPVLMFAAVLPSNINTGVRHLLPIYPFLAIAAAYAGMRLWRRNRFVAAAVLLWFAVSTTAAHPDYIASFNEMAGPHPEKIAVDNNLDWGQDLLRLAKVLRERGIEEVKVAYAGTAVVPRHIPFARDLSGSDCTTGWIAISEMSFHSRDADGNLRYQWLQKLKPEQRVGRSIWLYHVPTCD